MKNPLLRSWNTQYQTPPFEEIKTEHFKPAFEKALKQAEDEIAVITDNPAEPSFINTIEALENTGERLGIISSILFNLNSAETSKEIQEVARDIAPLLTRFSNDITLNQKLFERIQHVFNNSGSDLDAEQKMLLKRKYKSFIRGGSNLSGIERDRFRIVSEELSKLSLKFEENVLEETNSFELFLNSAEDLAGLPDSSVEIAAAEAEKRGKKGWIFTLHYPSYVPFMQYSEKRHLREKMLKAYSSRAFHSNEYDNRELVINIVNLRLELANLLGYNSYADFVLEERMAESRERVSGFLEELLKKSLPAAMRDFENIRSLASQSGFSEPVQRWDWAYYAEKLKKIRFDIDDEVLKPYFSLGSVQNAIFDLANRLYGLTFSECNNIQVYNPEVKTFEVFDNDGSFLSVLYIDYHPRPGKNGGAWMTSYREQRRSSDGKNIRPLVSVVANFTRPTSAGPALLSFQELTTLLHEFGHALHGMLSNCRYESLSGTNVYRDFVELPSQFMENFAFEPVWLSTWAVHYITGDKLPADLIEKIKEASAYNEGYACLRQLGFGLLDMAWHTIEKPVTTDVATFEKEVASRTELFPPVETSNMSCSFAHLFSGGYAAGYYGYKWAEVLDADAFSIFRKNGIFNKETALAFRKNILEKGGTEKPMNLYVRFKGQEPSIDALLERSGFINKTI